MKTAAELAAIGIFDPDEMNDKRAKWIKDILIHFGTLTGADEDEALGDILVDMRHYCDRTEIDFEAKNDAAERMYREEIAKVEIEE